MLNPPLNRKLPLAIRIPVKKLPMRIDELFWVMTDP